jgi:putative Mn2+ efflux pump MntP
MLALSHLSSVQSLAAICETAPLMSVVTSLLLASGLAVDSCVVALAQGIATTEHRMRRALVVGATFGAFQGLMPLIGWFAGEPIARAFASVDHWVAFAVLGALGAKSIRDALRGGESGEGPASFSARWLIAGAFATSIDALAAGFGLAIANEPIATTAIAAAVITGVGSLVSFVAGSQFAVSHRRVAQFVAGLVLIGIGAHILYTHLKAP